LRQAKFWWILKRAKRLRQAASELKNLTSVKFPKREKFIDSEASGNAADPSQNALRIGSASGGNSFIAKR
jgi:hypothetical protein